MRLKRWLVVAGAALYASSLMLPSIRGSGFPAQSGIDVLRQGAGAWEYGIVAWYANPALWVSWPLIWLGRCRAGLAGAALALALAVSSFGAATMAEHAGRNVPAFTYAVGFYVWLASIAVGVVAALVGIYKVSAPLRA
jgi:hypothetical protein